VATTPCRRSTDNARPNGDKSIASGMPGQQSRPVVRHAPPPPDEKAAADSSRARYIRTRAENTYLYYSLYNNRHKEWRYVWHFNPSQTLRPSPFHSPQNTSTTSNRHSRTTTLCNCLVPLWSDRRQEAARLTVTPHPAR
jgi:hypothetical protein